jgi:hypothetical protein
LVLKLKDRFPAQVKSSLFKALDSENAAIDRKIDLAKILMELGDEEGMNFIIEQMQGAELLPWGRDDSFRLARIDTQVALNKLSSMMHVLFVNRETRMMRKDVKSILLDFLFSLAEKSEEDLLIVDTFLSGIKERFKGHVIDFSELNRYRERMIENFRDTSEGFSSIGYTIKILEEIKGIAMVEN